MTENRANLTSAMKNRGKTAETIAYQRAAANYKRAITVHQREQARGFQDMSVQHTRRMALAVAALQRAQRKYADAQRELFNPSRTFQSAPGYQCGNAGCECSHRRTVTTHYRD